MNTMLRVTALLTFLGGSSVWLWAAEPSKTKAEIKELMGKVNKGDGSPMGKLSKELKAETPDWPEVQKQLKEVTDLGRVLGECKELAAGKTERYQKAVSALGAAAEKKDKAAALAARKLMLQSCGGCHYGGAPQGTGGGRD